MSSIFIIVAVIIFCLLAYFQHLVKKDEIARAHDERERNVRRLAELSRLRERAARRRAEQQVK